MHVKKIKHLVQHHFKIAPCLQTCDYHIKRAESCQNKTKDQNDVLPETSSNPICARVQDIAPAITSSTDTTDLHHNFS